MPLQFNADVAFGARGVACSRGARLTGSFADGTKGPLMVKRPTDMNAFEFAVVSGLRAAQLHRGCTPRVERCAKVAVTAQHEVAERKVLRMLAVLDAYSQTGD